MRSWPLAIRRRVRTLLEDVVALDGPQDEAPSLALMAREATELLDRTREERRAKTDSVRKRELKALLDETAWRAVKAAVRSRSGGRCEHVCCGVRCPSPGGRFDHFWSGSKRRSLESVESMWELCDAHDNLRTVNKPTRLYWVGCFEEHVFLSGLRTQAPLIVAERARIEGKRR